MSKSFCRRPLQVLCFVTLACTAICGIPARCQEAQAKFDGAEKVITGADGQPTCEAIDRQTGIKIEVPDCQGAKLVKQVEPVYPALARQTKISGAVKLHALIDKKGKVSELEVISGHPLLIQSAMDAVRQWRYTPMRVKGHPVLVETEIDVVFTLSQNPK